jgi:outer membrane protein TolC
VPRPTPEAVLRREIAAAGAAVTKASALVARRLTERDQANAAVAESKAAESAAKDRLARAEASLAALLPDPAPGAEEGE